MSTRAVERMRPGNTAPAPHRRRATNLWLSLALLGVTAAVYAPSLHYGYIYFDDVAYVFQNPHLSAGLTRDGIVWAWTQPEAGTWERPLSFYAPLTALSYLLDFQLFGSHPGPYHLGNVILHLLNTLLLFAIFTSTTAKPWRSAWVAGLFALHPLHVESVAWVSERKDVLSTCFWMLTTLAYIRYTHRPGARRYTLLLAAYVAALLSKPMVVTLPLVLLLLDVWPLGRVQGFAGSRGTSVARPRPLLPLGSLVIEKLPLVLLAVIESPMAFIIQQRLRTEGGTRPLAVRAAGALVSYATYLGKICWPTRLAVFYPFQPLPLAQVIAATMVLLGISILVVRSGRRYPYLLVGWLWYLGTLAPVIGLIQVGDQVRADRYTYVPSIGIWLIIAWGIPDLLGRWRYRHTACATAAVAALAAYTMLTVHQLTLWHDGQTLFEHTLAVTRDNAVAHAVLGDELLKQGHLDEAREHFLEVLSIAARLGPEEPYTSNAHANLGLILVRRGDLDAAQQHYEAAIMSNPSHVQAHLRLGMILAAQGDTHGALAHYREAVRLEPEFAAAHNNLAITLEDMGQADEALAEYAEGVRLEPQNAESRCNWAAALAKTGHVAEAIAQYRRVLQLKPQLAEAHFGLASTYAQAGRPREAVAELDGLLSAQPDSPALEATLAWVLATADDAQVRDGRRALQLAEDANRRTGDGNADVLNALAAAYAATDRFSEAVETAERALAAARHTNQTALLEALPARLAQYRAGQPLHHGDGHQ